MREAPWYHRSSYLVFLLIAAIGISQAIQLMIAPEAGYNLLGGFGYPLPEALSSEPVGREFTLFLIQWIGAVLLGADFLTAWIALTAWRKGEKWAWFAFLYWPFLFLFHFLLYRPGPHKYPPLFMLVLVVITLSVNARRFLTSHGTAERLLIADPQV